MLLVAGHVLLVASRVLLVASRVLLVAACCSWLVTCCSWPHVPRGRCIGQDGSILTVSSCSVTTPGGVPLWCEMC